VTVLIPATSKLYTIFVGADATTIDGRIRAVSEAKEISRRTGRPIRVERTDGRVRMEFRRGALETYRYETRDRRS
jgi:hypothetical protein